MEEFKATLLHQQVRRTKYNCNLSEDQSVGLRSSNTQTLTEAALPGLMRDALLGARWMAGCLPWNWPNFPDLEEEASGTTTFPQRAQDLEGGGEWTYSDDNYLQLHKLLSIIRIRAVNNSYFLNKSTYHFVDKRSPKSEECQLNRVQSDLFLWTVYETSSLKPKDVQFIIKLWCLRAGISTLLEK